MKTTIKSGIELISEIRNTQIEEHSEGIPDSFPKTL